MTTSETNESAVLERGSIQLGCESTDRDAAIAAVGGLLVERGLVTEAYIDAMLEREATVSTYMGNGVALPHGTFDAKDEVMGTGIAVMQYPGGVEWPNGTAHLVVGLAANNNDHVAVLSALAEVLQDEELCEQLWKTDDVDFVLRVLTDAESE